jgi:hypothetical protein
MKTLCSVCDQYAVVQINGIDYCRDCQRRNSPAVPQESVIKSYEEDTLRKG